MKRSQICAGSGMDAGRKNLKMVAAKCPECGASVAIMLHNRLQTQVKECAAELEALIGAPTP